MTEQQALRQAILEQVASYHAGAFAAQPFRPGSTPVPVAGRVFDEAELVTLVDAALDFWLTTGRYAEELEGKLAQFIGVKHACLCNSGSSANLLALSALTSPQLGDRRLRPGDEVITLAAGFPTTVNPIYQNQMTPVFVDVTLGTYNVDVTALAEAITPQTRAIMLPHTLGNPFEVDAVLALARQHDVWVIEDNCDALGARYRGQRTGSLGHLATHSFYPAHHITMGEGGCVMTADHQLKILVDSFRDWGRDCRCAPGEDNACGLRYEWQLGDLPFGYDHKYVYSHVGYNLKLTDLQAAIGVAQMDKLEQFIVVRRRNWTQLREGLAKWEEFFILPEATRDSEPSWFGFPLTVRPGAPFVRNELLRVLEDRRIGTRLLFGGNLTRQPAYQGLPNRIIGTLTNSDTVMTSTFWIGVYPGITPEMLAYVLETFETYLTAHT
jgi:CDP-6-deoxy-D-xylo-4-hexulose-3-dehydrase